MEVERPIYRFLLQLTGDEELAGDLTQDTLARGLSCRQQLRDVRQFKSWIFRIAVNLWKDYCRRPKLPSEPLNDLPAESDSSPHEQLVAEELGQQVWQALTKLPDRQQQVMHLRTIEQMSIGEIAEVLAIDRQLVRSNLSAARKNLRAKFKQSGII